MTIFARIPWQYVTRFCLFIGAIMPGLLLAIDPTYWSHTGVMKTVSNIPLPVWAYGVALLVAAILILFVKTRDSGYAIAGVTYLVFTFGAILSIGSLVSVLTFTLPVVCIAYFEACSRAAHAREISRGSSE